MSAPRAPRLLLSNDDGLHAPGIQALAEAVGDLGELWVVAPDRERSACSHAITLDRPLRAHEVQARRYAVDGTPTDCIYLALHHLLAERPPDLVLSGINRGPNLGDDVLYSGTVAAAMEGAFHDVPSVAFSLCVRGGPADFTHAAAHARAFTRALLGRALPPGLLLNVNYPEGPIAGTAWSTLGRRRYARVVTARHDPRGKPYFWIGGEPLAHEAVPGTDAVAVLDHHEASVTALTLGLGGVRPAALDGLEVDGRAIR